MAFGKKLTQQREQTTEAQQTQNQQTHNQASSQNYIDVEEEIQTKENASQEDHSQNNKKPLLQEVTMLPTQKEKNAGGTKRWKCKHCNKSYSSSYTRIHHHFFGTPVGVKSEIDRCTALLANRLLLQQVRYRVEQAEKTGSPHH
ncbi:hypothetical protein DCAR_0520632 [Daucus carota subsp. sativus]|uniref:BED-type domain-containing protein n=1 Tax=Daucus carota subsp. sativus TaxID=79200 RepID=A0AAF1B091_DAUCS|nr:hypothetical protein DCAR_0520632 [Daucus carota subsp. sativus]